MVAGVVIDVVFVKKILGPNKCWFKKSMAKKTFGRKCLGQKDLGQKKLW